ncbi:hypothetical protein [Candidatus Pantoea formicae]|uniref:hypothetical protein n=1 Tax=Candidatus Pantoea formicae TaxID=2608355 RepID=UPI00142108EB|nr:hypothetical protein [Pantoea formicae]MDF7647281.1 hypothetical protein [Erwiniaceae bacterium L1_54_3]
MSLPDFKQLVGRGNAFAGKMRVKLAFLALEIVNPEKKKPAEAGFLSQMFLPKAATINA